MPTTIPSTEFQTRAGRYIEDAAKGPVFITKHARPVRVLIDIEEYERLKSLDTQQAKRPVRFNDDTPEAAAHRAQQADVDSDIEGMTRDPELEAYADGLVEQGLPIEERVALIKDYAQEKAREKGALAG